MQKLVFELIVNEEKHGQKIKKLKRKKQKKKKEQQQ